MKKKVITFIVLLSLGVLLSACGKKEGMPVAQEDIEDVASEEISDEQYGDAVEEEPVEKPTDTEAEYNEEEYEVLPDGSIVLPSGEVLPPGMKPEDKPKVTTSKDIMIDGIGEPFSDNMIHGRVSLVFWGHSKAAFSEDKIVTIDLFLVNDSDKNVELSNENFICYIDDIEAQNDWSHLTNKQNIELKNDAGVGTLNLEYLIPPENKDFDTHTVVLEYYPIDGSTEKQVIYSGELKIE